jgi:hypothetical protein
MSAAEVVAEPTDAAHEAEAAAGEPPATTEPAAEPEADAELEAAPPDPMFDAEARTATLAPASPPAAPAPTLTLPISPALATLLRQLAGFAELIERQDFPRAAALAAEVQRTIDDFDPLVYLPGLFAPHFDLVAACADALEPWLARSAELTMRTLAQRCQVDLEGFLAP